MKVNEYTLWRCEVVKCQKCSLAETRTQVVVSREKCLKNEKKVFLLGEAPGGNEDLEGIPFCGQAGGILQEFLRLSGLSESEIYIGNVVKCRPVKPSKRGRYGNYANRKPTSGEMKTCIPWLREELKLVEPKILVTLGNVPLSFVLGKSRPIGDYHGKEFYSEELGLWVFPLYHPAALIYDRNKRQAYEEDVCRLKDFIKDF
ncbi:MAG: uracil-DNA glycosylase [Bacillota bacterium]|jgi:uracil-DNA glycosylase family 4